MDKLIKVVKSRSKFILYMILKVFIMILGLVTNIFIIRKLSVDDFGIFSVALMFVGLITTLGFSWSSSSILYYGSREREKTGSINKTFWARNIIIAFSLGFTTFLFILFGQQINGYIGQDVSFLLLIWLYVSVAEDYLIQYFLVVKKQVMSGMLSLTAKLMYLVMVLVFNFDIETLITLNIISHSTVLLYIWGINKKDIGKFEYDKEWFKEVLNFSLWQLFGFSGLYLMNFGDIAVIKYFMGNEDVAVYNAAYKLFLAIAGFSFVISSYYASNVTSYFATNNFMKIRDFYYRERIYIFALSIAAHLLVIFFAENIIITLYGEVYIESADILIVLLFGSMFRYLTVFYMLYYNINGKHKMLQTINIFSALLNLGLAIIFIQIFGLIGPAIATTITILLTFLFSFIYCEKRIKIASKE